MSATTRTLVEFLTACLDEDERTARALIARTPHRWRHMIEAGQWIDYSVVHAGNPAMDDVAGSSPELIAEVGGSNDWGHTTAEHIARHDPARVLAEVAAKRRIVERYRDELTRRDAFQADDARAVEGAEQATLRRSAAARCRGLEIAVELLALSFADHPEYRDEWRPE